MAKIHRITGDTYVASLGHLVRAGETVADGHPMLKELGDRVEVVEDHDGPVSYEHEKTEPARQPHRPAQGKSKEAEK